MDAEVCEGRKLGLYKGGQHILLIGEGNFSFAAALCTKLGGNHIVATSLDSYASVKAKYGSIAETAIKKVKLTGGKVEHKIDATDVNAMCSLTKLIENKNLVRSGNTGFDKIVFNFPHCGGGTAIDVAKNQALIQQVLTASKSVLKDKRSEIHIALRDTTFYNSWKVPELATKSGLKVRSKTSFQSLKEFQDLGYKEARTNPATRDAPATEQAVVYIIGKLK